MAIFNLGKKKKRLGFAEKQRTREEVNQEYNHHAVMYGHISRIMNDNQILLEQHLDAMRRLNVEGSKTQPEPQKASETKPTEQTPA